MPEHPFLYEIVQKAFNAGQQFKDDTKDAIHNNYDLPSAFPVITPLIEELVAYVDELVQIERERCAEIAEFNEDYMSADTILENHIGDANKMVSDPFKEELRAALASVHITNNWAHSIFWPYLLPILASSQPVRPSSPFRSVEIVDGELK